MHRKVVISLATALFTITGLAEPASAQVHPSAIQTGSRVRFQLTGESGTWHHGELDGLRSDTLVIFSGDRVITHAVARIARIETPWRNKRAALVGAAVGAGVSFALAVGFTEAGSSDAAGAAAVGALIGAGVGSGRKTRVAATIGAAVGGAVGAIAFGATGTACEQGSNTYCNVVSGGIMVGIVGLAIGTGVGMLLPNWVRVPLDGLEVRAAPGAGVGLGWSVGW